MNRQQFMAELSFRLGNINSADREAALSYYTEYFDDAGPDQEQAVISQLGNPAIIAAQIVADASADQFRQLPPPYYSYPTVKKSFRGIWLIVLGILAAPIAFPLAIAAAGAIFALVVTLLSVVFALIVSVIAFAIAGICMLGVGIYSLFFDFATGMVLVGWALITVGLCLLVGLPITRQLPKLLHWMGRVASGLLNKIKGGNKDGTNTD